MPSRLAEVSWRPPRLETARLVLRGFEPTDLPHVFAYASDAETTRYMGWDRHQSQTDTRAFLDAVAVDYDAGQLRYAISERRAPEVAIGAVSLLWRPREHAVMELHYILARPHWGRGYLPEAARRLMRHAFETTDVARIYAGIAAENHASRRVVEKLGMQLEGVLRSARLLRGRRWDEAVYGMLRGELQD